jgi:pyruvate kinase
MIATGGIVPHFIISNYLRHTIHMQIIATIWKKPYYFDRNQAMIDAGVDAFRVKCSHWGAQDVSNALIQAREQINSSGKNIKLLADLPEAKLRLGEFPQNTFGINEGQEFRFLHGHQTSDPLAYIPFQTQNLANYLQEGDVFYLQDGQMSFEVTTIHSSNEFIARACNDGQIVQCTGMAVPRAMDQLDHIVPFIDEILQLLPQSRPDLVAFSFIKSSEMLETLISKLNKVLTPGWNPQIISKIESGQGIDNLDSILDLSNGIMVARGDLALSMPFEYIGLAQKQIIAKTRAKNKYSIVATGALTSMLTQNIPQRSDILDITNSCLDGASAIMLCNETAHNEHPERAVKAAKKIINAVE